MGYSTMYRLLLALLSTILLISGGKGSNSIGAGMLPSGGGTSTPEVELPADVQISTALRKGETKVYYYWSASSNTPLSVTITPCRTTIRWMVQYKDQNDTVLLGSKVTRGLYTLHFTSSKGIFLVHLENVDRDGSAAIYVSTEPGGPQPLQTAKLLPPLRTMNRQKRRQLTVRWNPSLVDPYVTQYCLVTSQKRNYTSLCEALGDSPMSSKSLVSFPELSELTAKLQKSSTWDKGPLKDPTIACVKTHTQYTLSGLDHGKQYYFNLFARNLESNFTYAYGSTSLKFDGHIKPTALKDGKPNFVNLRKSDGKVVFRYKVARASTEPLRLYVMPCGGAVDVEVTLKNNSIEKRRRVDGYGKIVIKNPLRGERYYIRVVTTNREELRRTSGVEVLASTKPSGRFPLPHMPSEAQVYEYASLRRCDSVTVGWLPSPEPHASHYCLVVREGRLRELDGYRMPNQCGLETRLKKSADFSVKYCLNVRKEKSEVITQKISHLKPGRVYVIQVTVRKTKGKTLSYDLLQVHTKRYCDYSNKFN